MNDTHKNLATQISDILNQGEASFTIGESQDGEPEFHVYLRDNSCLKFTREGWLKGIFVQDNVEYLYLYNNNKEGMN